MRRVLATACLILASCSHQPATRVDQGREVLERALEALGGADAIREQKTWDVEGTGRENLSAEAQGISPESPTWRDHDERVAVDTTSLTVAWYRKSKRNDDSVRWRRMIYTPDASGYYDYVVNDGVLRPGATPEMQRRRIARRIPHLLLLEAASEASRVELRKPRERSAGIDDEVSAWFADGTELTLLIGTKNHLLHAAELHRHIPTFGDSVVRWEWNDWAPHPSLGSAPRGHRVLVNGIVFQEVTYSRYETGREIREMFEVAQAHEPDESSSPEPPGAAMPASGEVAPGVHVVSVNGFTMMFVETDDFVVAFEAPAVHIGLEGLSAPASAPAITAEFLKEIRNRVPDKPLRYAVVSHHHSDHMGGIRTLAAAGATILVAPSHRDALLRALDAPHTEVPDEWSSTARNARVETVSERRVLGSGSRRIEILNIGANPHTDEILFAWLPEERIVFQGDLFYYGGSTFPPSGRGRINRFFAGWLGDHGIEPRAVYSVHNDAPASPEHLARARSDVH